MLWNAFGLLVLGMIFLNVIFAFVALVYLIFLVVAIWNDPPEKIRITRARDEIKAFVNEKVEIRSRLSIGKGAGIVTVSDLLPEHFELVKSGSVEGEAGSNFRVFWKGRAPLDIDMGYGLNLTKRGIYDVQQTVCESIDSVNFRPREIVAGGGHLRIMVRHRTLNLKKMRDPRVLSRIPMPLGAMTKLGISTNEFRELREYAPGDPYNRINWKATARLSCGRPNATPFVNEFEREGKKTVWVFVDASNRMRLGTEIENIFEYAVRAVSGVSQFYLARNCGVGVAIYNTGKTILPDTGRRQEFKIKKTLIEVELSTRYFSLAHAVDSLHGYLVGQNPLFIIITMVNRDNIGALLDGIKKMHIYSIAGRSQIIVVHMMGYDMVAKNPFETSGAKLLDLSILPSLRALRRAGAFVVPWDAKTQILQKLLVVGAKRR
jgi:uncharacterized protein (DUF58 family)